MAKYPPYLKKARAVVGPPQGKIQIGVSTRSAVLRAIPRAANYVPASPGVDGLHNFGPFVSGASTGGSLAVRTSYRESPTDWSSQNDTWGHKAGGGVNSIFPAGKKASSLRNRRRGLSPFGGYSGSTLVESGSGLRSERVQKPGGTMDHNAGADSAIAGGVLGHLQASTMVRLHGTRGDRNMRLPVMPEAAKRSGVAMRPAGAAVDGGPAAPFVPVMHGMPSIFGFFTTPRPAPVVKDPAIRSCGQ